MQLHIDFEPDLQRQFDELMDVVKASVYGCGKPFKHIAADLDMSVSELSRKLNPSPTDNVNFPLKFFTKLIDATGDLRPLLWLVARYLPNDDERRNLALRNAERLLAELGPALAELRSEGSR